jgi:hypothetical protein
LQIKVAVEKQMNTTDMVQFWIQKDDFNINRDNRHQHHHAVRELKRWFIRSANN